MLAGLRQFSAQLIGLVLAITISLVISHRLGAGPDADAFVLGRRLVTGLQELLAQVLVLVFIPMVAAQSGRRAFAMLGLWVGLVGVALGLVFALLAGPIVALVAPAMAADTATLAARVIAVLAASLPLALVGVLMGASLNLRGRFGGPALARLAPRLFVLIGFLTLAGTIVVPVSWAFVAGNAVALAMMAALLVRAPSPVQGTEKTAPKSRPHVWAALMLVAGGQVALWLETGFAAASGAGGVTLLEMAQRVGALLGNTLALALVMPLFARWSADGTARNAAALRNLVIAGAALLILPQGALALHSARIAHDLFGQGAFDAADQARLLTLLWVMVLPPFATLLSRAMMVWVLTASGKQGQFPKIAGAVMVDLAVRVLAGTVLMPVVGLPAVALGMVLGPLASAALLWGLTRRMDGPSAAPSSVPPSASGGWRLIVVAIVALLVTVSAALILPIAVPWVANPALLPAITHILGTSTLGALVFVAILATQGWWSLLKV